MSLGEVALGLFGLFLLTGPFGRLEHLICETLELAVVSGFVLSLGGEKCICDSGNLQIHPVWADTPYCVMVAPPR
jgi:hypothetical protein